MSIRFSDNAATTLAGALAATDTQLMVAAGSGAKYPALSGADGGYVILTLEDALGNREKIRADYRAGDLLGSATYPLQRGYGGTVARAWVAGSVVDLRANAVGLDALRAEAQADLAVHAGASNPHPQYATAAALTAHTGAVSGAHAASAVSNAPAGSLSSTTVQGALNELDGDMTAMSAAKADKTVSILAGAGLSGGGDLSANRTLTVASNSNGYGLRNVSTSAPSGGADGDMWYQV